MTEYKHIIPAPENTFVLKGSVLKTPKSYRAYYERHLVFAFGIPQEGKWLVPILANQANLAKEGNFTLLLNDGIVHVPSGVPEYEFSGVEEWLNALVQQVKDDEEFDSEMEGATLDSNDRTA